VTNFIERCALTGRAQLGCQELEGQGRNAKLRMHAAVAMFSFARNTLTQRLFVFRCVGVLVNTLSRTCFALTSSVEMQIQPAHGGLHSNNALSRIRTQVSDKRQWSSS